MRRIDQILAQNPFSVDETACYLSAQLISKYRGDEDTSPWSAQSTANRLLFKIAFISICHQINWDFLQSRLAENLLKDGKYDLLRLLSEVTSSDLNEWLSGYSKPERIRAAERASILRDIASTIYDKFEGDVLSLYTRSNGEIQAGTGFLSMLDNFRSFSEDPLKKKSYVLLQELTRERILRFKDEASIQPAIDYHILRVYLRTGRVICTSAEVQELLKKNGDPRIRLVQLLRKTVAAALDLTAFYANLPVSEVNYIEWQVGRAVCISDAPACVTLIRDPDLDNSVAALFDGPCPYLTSCQACRDPEWLQLKQPELKKSFY